MLWTILNISFLIVYIIVVIKYLPNITNILDTKKFNSQYQLTPEFTKPKYSYAVCFTFSRISLAMNIFIPFSSNARVLRHFSNRLLSVDSCASVWVNRRVQNLFGFRGFLRTDMKLLGHTPFIEVFSTVWIGITGYLYIIVVRNILACVFHLSRALNEQFFIVVHLLLFVSYGLFVASGRLPFWKKYLRIRN